LLYLLPPDFEEPLPRGEVGIRPDGSGLRGFGPERLLEGHLAETGHGSSGPLDREKGSKNLIVGQLDAVAASYLASWRRKATRTSNETTTALSADLNRVHTRSEERRVGKECRSRWSPYNDRKKNSKQPHKKDA